MPAAIDDHFLKSRVDGDTRSVVGDANQFTAIHDDKSDRPLSDRGDDIERLRSEQARADAGVGSLCVDAVYGCECVCRRSLWLCDGAGFRCWSARLDLKAS